MPNDYTVSDDGVTLDGNDFSVVDQDKEANLEKLSSLYGKNGGTKHVETSGEIPLADDEEILELGRPKSLDTKQEISLRRPGGPGSYRDAFREQAYSLALLGLNNREMAKFFGVREDTFQNWLQHYPLFREAVYGGRISADATVARAFFNKARGFERRYTKTVIDKEGTPHEIECVDYYPPDARAATMWLASRQRKLWGNKVEVTGKDGGPIEVSVTHEHISDRISRALIADEEEETVIGTN